MPPPQPVPASHHHNVTPVSSSGSRSIKHMFAGLVVGLVVGMQVMLVRVSSNEARPSAGSTSHHASAALFGAPRADFPTSLPEGALEHDVRTPDHPWPKPLTPSELAHWLDVLGNYTDKGAAQKAAPAEDVPRQSVDNPLQDFAAAASGPVNIKEWVGQGKCKHADLYLAQILDRLQPWSNGGISRGMIENAARKGEERSNFGGLHYQIVDGNVYARSEGNNYWVEFYAGLFANTLRHIKMPNIELALHNGLDLPVMLKHEVHPAFGYASSDAFNEILVPCQWYIFPLAATIANTAGQWAPPPLEAFKAQAGKVFWRGSPNDFIHYTKDNFRFAPRMKLVEQWLRHPDLVDAQITSSLVLLSGEGWDVECAVYEHIKLAEPEGANGPCSEANVEKYRNAQTAKARLFDETDNGFRYALNMEGTGVSERLAHQLASSQLVFKVDSPFYNYYSRFFIPYVHYIPVKYDLSDLVDKVAWANEHVEEAHAIMVRSSTLAHELFHPDEVTCYTALALAAYGRLLGFEPQLRKDVTLYE